MRRDEEGFIALDNGSLDPVDGAERVMSFALVRATRLIWIRYEI